jgi:hypothetical protein
MELGLKTTPGIFLAEMIKEERETNACWLQNQYYAIPTRIVEPFRTLVRLDSDGIAK